MINKKQNNKGFTLIELIVVITILALLATVAFFSFEGQNQNARNTKRTADIATISKAISVELASGYKAVTTYVDDTNDYALTGGTLNVGGYDDVLAGDNYKAGIVDFKKVTSVTEEVTDPAGDYYRIGAISVNGKFYQLAATLESETGDKLLVSGNYSKRDTTFATGSLSKAVTSGGTKLILNENIEGVFKLGDIITGTGATGTGTGKIESIFGKTIKLETGSTIAGAIGDIINLDNGGNETELILGDDGTNEISESNLPYTVSGQ